MDKKISFIIRTLNEEKDLKHTLQCIRKQTNNDVEIIIVDSGSTDNTLNIAYEYQCKIINVGKDEWSWGLALNKGINAANGDIIAVISAHCFLADNNSLTIVDLYLDRVDVVYGAQLPVDNVDPFEEIELALWYPDTTILDNHNRIKEFKGIGVSNACCFFNKLVWYKHKFDENLQSMEDLEWAVRVANDSFHIAYTADFFVYHSHNFKIDYIYKKWFCRQFESYSFLLRQKKITKKILYIEKIKNIVRILITPYTTYKIKNKLNYKYSVGFLDAFFYCIVRNVAIYDGYNAFLNKKDVNYTLTSIKNNALLNSIYGCIKISWEIK